jgi:hypothetical protein
MTMGHRGTVMTKAKASPTPSGRHEVPSPTQEQQIMEAIGTFSDVYELLEEYSPAWYSSKMRRKLQTALRSLRILMPHDMH